MDPRTLQEIDQTPTHVRLVIPAGYPATLPFEWPIDLTGYTDWKLWIKANAGASTQLDAAPDTTDQADGLIVMTFTLEQVTAAAKYGANAIWAHTVVNPDGDLIPLAAGPVIIDRTARRG